MTGLRERLGARRSWLIVLAAPILAALVLMITSWDVFKSEHRTQSSPATATPTAAASADLDQQLEGGPDAFLSCSDCHKNLDRSLERGQHPSLLFTHKKHFSIGVTLCSECHVANTHSGRTTIRPTMTTCSMCHQRSPQAAAPGTCRTCHPASIARVPPSHTKAEWIQVAHPAVAKESGGFDCAVCHEQQTCTACHGLVLPHPAEWKRAPHAAAYFDDPTLCAGCHQTVAEQPSGGLCDSCHHPQRPRALPWSSSHAALVATQGASTCFQCHAPSTCATCHRSGRLDLTADQQMFSTNPSNTYGTGGAGG